MRFSRENRGGGEQRRHEEDDDRAGLPPSAGAACRRRACALPASATCNTSNEDVCEHGKSVLNILSLRTSAESLVNQIW